MPLSAALFAATLFLPSAPLKEPPVRFSCAMVRSLVKTYGEPAVISGARSRGVPEHVIQHLKRKSLEAE